MRRLAVRAAGKAGLAAILDAVSKHRYRTTFVIAAMAAVVLVIIIIPRPPEPLVIYSSLPTLEPGATRSARTSDMVAAMQLAMAEAGSRAGRFKVRYVALDDSDPTGTITSTSVQGATTVTVDDPNTAVYIGDFNSSATQYSLPVLSRHRIPQISPGSTRLGLTLDDPIGDTNEPGRYYYHDYLNFVRIVPTTAVLARALLAQLATDSCKAVAMINDGTSYGIDLANSVLYYNHGFRFLFSQSVDAYGKFKYYAARAQKLASTQKTLTQDCFVYSGVYNPSTGPLFKAFASALGPKAKLYGTLGVGEPSFYGEVASLANVTVMVPPRVDNSLSQQFTRAFTAMYHPSPDPYAYYAYDAMQLALNAVSLSDGTREDILAKLRGTPASRPSVLGSYTITPAGDTTLTSVGMSALSNGVPMPPVLVAG